MPKYDTNLAAEFYILSCLHRLGISANLTLGNRKGVDIVVARDSGDVVTIDVKGIAKKYDWPADNLSARDPDRHFVVLVCFNGVIADPKMPSPDIWVIPYARIRPFIRNYATRINVSRAAITTGASKYKDAWYLIEKVNLPVSQDSVAS